MLSALLAAVALLGGCARDREPGELPTRRAESEARPTTSTTEDVPPSSVPSGTGFPDGWTPAPLTWSGCPDLSGAECAALEVPLDWDDPLGPTIDLALARTRATGDRIGSLLTNPGVRGPRASSTSAAGRSAPR